MGVRTTVFLQGEKVISHIVIYRISLMGTLLRIWEIPYTMKTK